MPCNADDVDAVAVPLAVGQVVPKMGVVHADRLATGKDFDVLPDRLLIPEAGPAMVRGLVEELLPRAAYRGLEEGEGGRRVVEGDGLARRQLPREGSLTKPIAGVLGKLMLVAADVVGRGGCASPP